MIWGLADHAFSPRDVVNGAWNLRVLPWTRALALNYHHHKAHHHGDDDQHPADLIDRDFTATEPGTKLVGASPICARASRSHWRSPPPLRAR